MGLLVLLIVLVLISLFGLGYASGYKKCVHTMMKNHAWSQDEWQRAEKACDLMRAAQGTFLAVVVVVTLTIFLVILP